MTKRQDEINHHLGLSSRLSAASKDLAAVDPVVAREMADDAEELLALVETLRSQPDDEPEPEPEDDGPDDDDDGPRFARVIAMQKRIVRDRPIEPFDDVGEAPIGRNNLAHSVLTRAGRLMGSLVRQRTSYPRRPPEHSVGW